MADRWMDERDRQMRERDWRWAEERDRNNQEWEFDADGDNYLSAEDRTWEQERAARYYGGEYAGGPDYPTYVSSRPVYGGQRTRSGGYGGRVTSGYGGDYARSGPYGRSTSYDLSRSPGPAGGYDSGSGRSMYGPAFGPRHDAERHDVDRDSFMYRAGERVASWFGGGHHHREEPRHRGRGPQGYKRSDERINDDAHERLTDDNYLDASDISISVSGGEVTLSGTVDSREAKHRAERLVEDISGVNHVQNNLRVARGNPLTTPGRGYGDSVLDAQMRGENPGVGAHGRDDDDKGRKLS